MTSYPKFHIHSWFIQFNPFEIYMGKHLNKSRTSELHRFILLSTRIHITSDSYQCANLCQHLNAERCCFFRGIYELISDYLSLLTTELSWHGHSRLSSPDINVVHTTWNRTLFGGITYRRGRLRKLTMVMVAMWLGSLACGRWSEERNKFDVPLQPSENSTGLTLTLPCPAPLPIIAVEQVTLLRDLLCCKGIVMGSGDYSLPIWMGKQTGHLAHERRTPNDYHCTGSSVTWPEKMSVFSLVIQILRERCSFLIGCYDFWFLPSVAYFHSSSGSHNDVYHLINHVNLFIAHEHLWINCQVVLSTRQTLALACFNWGKTTPDSHS